MNAQIPGGQFIIFWFLSIPLL